MGKSKIVYGNQTLIDLTADTVTADRLWSGYTAHGADGEPIVGTLATVPMDPEYYDYNIGYIDNGTWKYENPTRTYTDIYPVISGHTYLIMLGQNVGSRFRSMFTETDITTVSSGNIVGTRIINLNNPAPHNNATYTAPSDGYILVAKDNVGKSGVKTYVYDAAGWE